MIDGVNSFLEKWWRGLVAPWHSAIDSRSRVTIEDGEFVYRSRKNSSSLLIVPTESLLITKLQSGLSESSISDLVADHLPFSMEEVYATRIGNSLHAVLKSEVTAWQTKAAAENIEINALQLSAADADTMISLVSDASTSTTQSYKPLFVFGLILLTTVGAVSVLFDRVNSAQTNELATLQTRISNLRSSLNESSDTNLSQQNSFSVNTAYQLLQDINTSLPSSASVKQLSITPNASELSIVIDAEADSSSEFLRRLEEHDSFIKSEFVSAITTDNKTATDRFRVQTFYTSRSSQSSSTLPSSSAEPDSSTPPSPSVGSTGIRVGGTE